MSQMPETAIGAKTTLDQRLQAPIDPRYLLDHIRPLKRAAKLVEELKRISSGNGHSLADRRCAPSTAKSAEIIYYYVVDEDDRPCGVVPHSAIVAFALRSVSDEEFDAETVTVESVTKLAVVIRVEESATMLDAYEAFVGHEFLAVPMVDANGRFLCCVSRAAFDAVKSDLFAVTDDRVAAAESLAKQADQDRQDAEDELEETEAELGQSVRELEAAHGLPLSSGADRTELKELGQRAIGISFNLCHSILTLVMLTYFEGLMQQITLLASLLPTFLTSAESLGGQASHLALHDKSGRQRLAAFFREARIAAVLALGCSALVATVVLFRHSQTAAACIFVGLFLSMLKTAVASHLLPAGLRKVGFEPNLVAGSVVLAIADIVTISLVFGITKLMV